MSPEDVPKQSLAGQLLPELISHVFEFYESDLPPYLLPRYRREIFNFSAVCVSWRAASLSSQSYNVYGYDKLRALIDMLKSRSSADDRAVTYLSYSSNGAPTPPDELLLLCELLEMSAASLRSFCYHLSFRESSPPYAGKLLDVICSATRLMHLQWWSSNPIPLSDVFRLASSCIALRQFDLSNSILYPSASAIPSPTLSTVLHHRITHLHLGVSDHRDIQLLASLLSSNTISHLILADSIDGNNSTAQPLAPLIPLLLQHAHQFKEFTYNSQPLSNDGGDDDPLRLDTLLPRLTSCRRLTLPARSLSEDDAIDPSVLPSLQYLEMSFKGYTSPWILEDLVRERGGITLKEIELEFGPCSHDFWTGFIELCKEKRVELSILEDNYWVLQRGVLLDY